MPETTAAPAGARTSRPTGARQAWGASAAPMYGHFATQFGRGIVGGALHDGTTEGFATLTDILALKPGTKVIVASGHGARESALKAIALGAYDFYRKPVDIDELGDQIIRSTGRGTISNDD